jgi:hypothetical protein
MQCGKRRRTVGIAEESTGDQRGTYHVFRYQACLVYLSQSLWGMVSSTVSPSGYPSSAFWRTLLASKTTQCGIGSCASHLFWAFAHSQHALNPPTHLEAWLSPLQGLMRSVHRMAFAQAPDADTLQRLHTATQKVGLMLEAELHDHTLRRTLATSTNASVPQPLPDPRPCVEHMS